MEELARRAGISSRTVARAEIGNGVPRVTARTLELITRALEAGGVEFTSGDATFGLGVRLRRR
jgi:transcriptional regulator with XRE-family HTH domain